MFIPKGRIKQTIPRKARPRGKMWHVPNDSIGEPVETGLIKRMEPLKLKNITHVHLPGNTKADLSHTFSLALCRLHISSSGKPNVIKNLQNHHFLPTSSKLPNTKIITFTYIIIWYLQNHHFYGCDSNHPQMVGLWHWACHIIRSFPYSDGCHPCLVHLVLVDYYFIIIVILSNPKDKLWIYHSYKKKH